MAPNAPITAPAHPRSFYGWMVFAWVWPLLVVLAAFDWRMPLVTTRLFWKLSWVLFAGMVQGLILLCVYKIYPRTRDFWAILMAALFVPSLLLLPYGMCEWVVSGRTGAFGPSVFWEWGVSFLLSMLAHMIPGLLLLHLLFPGARASHLPPVRRGGFADGGASGRSGSGLWGGRSWLDDVWRGGQISDDFIGHRGEFDVNDEARRVSEDMQQFHSNHRDADLTDHYYWDDVLDADTDGYLE